MGNGSPDTLAPPAPVSNPQARSRSELLPTSRRQAIIEVFFIFVVFFVHAGWPAPDVNEAHYLCKAKQFWNEAWLPGDFFLNSSDAHLVFYWTLGWLTRFMSLSAFAWTGRVLTWAALAWAWQRLSFALIPRPWFAILSAAIFVPCVWFAAAGEWVVGGFEAKGPAYVLAFLGLERLVKNRWNSAIVLFGAASAFHVLVGGWILVASGICWLLMGRRRPPLRSLAWGVLGGFVLALPGLVPAFALSWSAPDDVFHEANEIYVAWRLRHHLLPDAFPLLPIVLGIGAWLILFAGGALLGWQKDLRYRRLSGVVFGALAVAAVGFLLPIVLGSRPPLLHATMRFYWFRMADVFVPVGLALWLVALSAHFFEGSRVARMALIGLILVATWHVCRDAYDHWGAPPPADFGPRVAYEDWLAICRAAKEETSPEARFLTPRYAQTFHWHAERAEVVNQKDIPQDAYSIVQWHRRMLDVHKSRHGEIPLAHQGEEEVRRLANRYEADYVITYASPPLNLPLKQANRTYALYEVGHAAQP
jgi:hypothetical protein